MSMIFTTCIYHVCQLLYYSIVHTLYIHGTDVSVHVYARWSGFQMESGSGSLNWQAHRDTLNARRRLRPGPHTVWLQAGGPTVTVRAACLGP